VRERSWTGVVVAVCAAALALAAALPAVWWEPLHLDERLMLEFSPHGPLTILHEIFVDRGGAPLQFLVEHITLSWPGGLAGLRLPSLTFFVLALAFAGPVVRALVGEREGWITVLLLALAPLSVGLATFARMYALLLWLGLGLVAAWLSLRAGASGARRDWVMAGALCGALVYAHPIAPLYALPAFACGLAVSPLPLREAVVRARSGVIAGVVVSLPYVYALAVLRSRYDVGEAGPIATTAGRIVPEEALYALTPAGLAGLAVFSFLALVGAIRLVRADRRVGVLLVLWVVVPMAFFTAVPAGTRFFGRYLIGALPAFLALAAAGCAAVGRRPALVAALAVALLALEIGEDVDRLRTLHRLDLRELAAVEDGQVLFSSTGLPRSDRPPELLDDYVVLRSSSGDRVEELPAIDPRYDPDVGGKGVRAVKVFLAHSGEARGVWLFRGNERRVAAAARRLARDPDVVARRVGPELLVVKSRRPASRRALVALAAHVREAWGTEAPVDRWPRTIARIDRAALRTG
jgi:hypothetical protein